MINWGHWVQENAYNILVIKRDLGGVVSETLTELLTKFVGPKIVYIEA
jgi:hypothetical protein